MEFVDRRAVELQQAELDEIANIAFERVEIGVEPADRLGS